MGSTNAAAIIAALGAVVAAGIAAWVTRKGAKESQQRTDQKVAMGMYPQLFQDLRTDSQDLRKEVQRLTQRVVSLEGVIVASRNRARVHLVWDGELVAQLESAVPGFHIRPAPPLLEDEDDT